MLKKYIINGCEMWLTEATATEILDFYRQLEEEHEAWELTQRAYQRWLETNDPADWDWYSDIFKSYWGIRPRW